MLCQISVNAAEEFIKEENYHTVIFFFFYTESVDAILFSIFHFTSIDFEYFAHRLKNYGQQPLFTPAAANTCRLLKVLQEKRVGGKSVH